MDCLPVGRKQIPGFKNKVFFFKKHCSFYIFKLHFINTTAPRHLSNAIDVFQFVGNTTQNTVSRTGGLNVTVV